MTDWIADYERLIAQIPDIARSAPLLLCGLSACVDARLSAHELHPLLGDNAPAPARSLAQMVIERARSGIGGEVRIDWPSGPDWLRRHVPVSFALGGTGPQAAWSLATIGAPALIALEDRSAHKLAHVHPDIFVAEGGYARPAREIAARGPRQPEIFIIEYTAGQAIGEVIPARSSRIIVRFHDPGLEHDAEFARVSVKLAPTSGAGLVSGFNSVAYDDLPSETEPVRHLIENWRRGGIAIVHLELAGYDTPRHRDRTIEALAGGITSLGMSYSEFLQFEHRSGDVVSDMAALASLLGLTRLTVHADHWAASVTHGDPEVERDALLMGCLLAGARAANGVPVYPHAIASAARFSEPPFPPTLQHGGWSFVCCASPYLDFPKATVGLGDSFTGGCLLMLGRQRAAHNTIAIGAPDGHALEAR